MLQGGRRDERQVDRHDHDRVRASGDRVVAGLADAPVEALAALEERSCPGRRGPGEHLAIRADDERLVDRVRVEGGPDGPLKHVDRELPALLRVERATEA